MCGLDLKPLSLKGKGFFRAGTGLVAEKHGGGKGLAGLGGIQRVSSPAAPLQSSPRLVSNVEDALPLDQALPSSLLLRDWPRIPCSNTVFNHLSREVVIDNRSSF